MQKLLARHPRLTIEHFPSYTPELNPDEGVWALAKKELANGCPKNVDGLMESIICVIDGIRKSPAKLRGCILQSDLSLFFELIIALFNVRPIMPGTKHLLSPGRTPEDSTP